MLAATGELSIQIEDRETPLVYSGTFADSF
jgi:hypothetical protein